MLIVDDSEDDRLLLRSLLSRSPYALLDAATGAEALEVVARERVDCVLLDYRLPDRDGLELLEDIRAEDEGASVVVITGWGDEMIASSVIKGGADDYLPKHALTRQNLHKAVEDAIQDGRERRGSARKTVSVDEAAEMLGICRNTAYAAIQRGEIPVLKIGRRFLVPLPALERMLAGQSPIANGPEGSPPRARSARSAAPRKRARRGPTAS